MSEKWFPVINYSKCQECGACVTKCSHGVYDKEKAPSPLVIYPEGCIDGCHGCGNLCVQKAIAYSGELEQFENTNSCSCTGNCTC